MNELDGFSMDGDRAVYRPVGSVAFDDAVAGVSAAITLACANKATDLLVDATALTGFASPNVFQRFLAVTEWAERKVGTLRLAIIALPHMIDPDKFGVTVAANRGLASNIFTTEAEARAWLDAQRGVGT